MTADSDTSSLDGLTPRSPAYSLELARVVDTLGWPDLEAHAHQVLNAMITLAEADGVQRREVSIHRGQPSSTAPHTGSDCRCGCPSVRDHHQRALETALEVDVADGGEPVRFRGALLRAAEDLRSALLGREGVRALGEPESEEDSMSPERARLICERYPGVPSRRGSLLESESGRGYISPEAFRRCRGRNGYGLELGWPHPPDEELVEQVLLLHFSRGMTDREIARELDLADSTVSRWLKGRRNADSQAAA